MKPTRPGSSSGNTAVRKTIGAMDILEWAGHESGINDDLLASADRGTAQKLMSVARYWTANPGGTIPRMEEWEIDHMVPYEDGLSEDMYYDLMASIGKGASVQQRYFSARADRMPSRASVAVDSTTISSCSENLNDVRYGYNKNGDGLAAIKVMTLFCTETRQPIAFMRQPGNISDVISVTNTVKQLDAFGMEKPLVVLDGGFFSEDNILSLMKENTKFLMRGQLDEFVRLDFLDLTSNDDSICQFSEALSLMSRLDSCFCKVNQTDCKERFQNGIDIFNSQPACVGFIVSTAILMLGRPGSTQNKDVLLKRWLNYKDSLITLIEKMEEMQLDKLTSFLSLNTLSEKLNTKRTGKVGDFEREFFKSAFTTLYEEGENLSSF